MTAASPASPAAANQELEDLGRKFAIPVMSSIADAMLDPTLLAGLPVEWARSHVMLPVRHADQLAVLTCNPADIAGEQHLALLLGRELTPLLAPRAAILSAIERCYFSGQETPQEFLRDLDQPDNIAAASTRADDLLQVAENAPVTQLINLILLEAVKAGASDVHVEPFADRLRVRYRIDGALYEQAAPPKHLEAALVSRLKVMARLDISERRLPQDGAARVRIGEREIDIRVSTIPVAEGERVVLRLLNRSATLLPLSGLGLAAEMLTALEGLLQETHGVILVCGPTGSGKTTTLYAALQRLNKIRANILTIEDPIEYQLPDIGQIQVKPKIGLSFAAGLRHILRQDPDTILVGEIRDLETAEIAIRASLTGHLVFSTLHTNDAPSAVVRLIDMGIEPYLLSASLRAVLAQRLARRLCPACRRQIPAGPNVPQGLRAKIKGLPIWEAQGCAACLEGYRGRIGLFELMIVDQAIAAALHSGTAAREALPKLAARPGNLSLLDDGLAKMAQGITSLSEIIRAVGRLAYDNL